MSSHWIDVRGERSDDAALVRVLASRDMKRAAWFTEEQLYGFLLMEFLENHPNIPLKNTMVLQRLTGLDTEQFNMAWDWLIKNSILEFGDTPDEFIQ